MASTQKIHGWGSGKQIFLCLCHSWSKSVMSSPSLDVSPILVLPVLLTAGKVRNFAELLMLSSSVKLPPEGEMGQRTRPPRLSSSQSPWRALPAGWPHAAQNKQISALAASSTAAPKSPQTTGLCITSRRQTELSIRGRDFKITRWPAACLSNQ